MNICTKLRQRLAEAKLAGYNSIIVEEMKHEDVQELSECGFLVEKHTDEDGNWYLIKE